MDQKFTSYLVNYLASKYKNKIDFNISLKITNLIKNSTIIREYHKLPRFLNQSERDKYDCLISADETEYDYFIISDENEYDCQIKTYETDEDGCYLISADENEYDCQIKTYETVMNNKYIRFEAYVQKAITKFIMYSIKSNNEKYLENFHLIDESNINIRNIAEKLAIQELVNYEINERDVRNLKYILSTEDGASVLKTIKKRLFKKQRFQQEAIALHIGLISKNSMKRCTTWQLQNRKNKHINDSEWSKKTVITNGKDTFSLATAGHTRSKKLAELYAFSKGIETVAQDDGMVWASVVCTVPAHMHPAPANGHSSWNGTLPNESADFLQDNWALTRAALAKYDITLSGLWTREAHSDGAPHINFMLYFNKEDKEQVQNTFFDYFRHSDSDSAIKWQDGGDVADGKKAASFASYAYKYFAKFISEDEMPSDEILCEEAWASAFSLRRYDFFGVPTRSQWRRERAQRTEPSTYSKLLKDSWTAARENNAAEWIKLNGGLGKKKKDRPIKVISELSATGKSRIAVGVEEKATGANFISKKIGEWTLRTLISAAEALNVVKKSSENTIIKTVTLDLSYPSKPKKQNQIIQKVFEITHPPPLLQ